MNDIDDIEKQDIDKDLLEAFDNLASNTIYDDHDDINNLNNISQTTSNN